MNVAPILANLYLTKLETNLREKNKNDPKMVSYNGQRCTKDSLIMDLELVEGQKAMLNTGLQNLTNW